MRVALVHTTDQSRGSKKPELFTAESWGKNWLGPRSYGEWASAKWGRVREKKKKKATEEWGKLENTSKKRGKLTQMLMDGVKIGGARMEEYESGGRIKSEYLLREENLKNSVWANIAGRSRCWPCLSITGENGKPRGDGALMIASLNKRGKRERGKKKEELGGGAEQGRNTRKNENDRKAPKVCFMRGTQLMKIKGNDYYKRGLFQITKKETDGPQAMSIGRGKGFQEWAVRFPAIPVLGKKHIIVCGNQNLLALSGTKFGEARTRTIFLVSRGKKTGEPTSAEVQRDSGSRGILR